MTTVGYYLRRARLAAGYSQPELAKILGFGQSKVSRMETSERNAKVSDINKWMDVTKATLHWREEAIRLTSTVPTNQRTLLLSDEALTALSDLSRHRGWPVPDNEVVSEALVFTRDVIVRLGSWRTHPKERS